MGAVNCFPQDQSEETKKEDDGKTTEQKLTDANNLKDSLNQDGENKDAGETSNTKDDKDTTADIDQAAPDDKTVTTEVPVQKKKKLNRDLVLAVWKEKRGDAPGPSDKIVKDAIKSDDFDKSGKLEKKECKRLCESFKTRADKNSDKDFEFKDWEEVFDFVDYNGDGILDHNDIKFIMTAMWLMTTDKVKVQDFISKD